LGVFRNARSATGHVSVLECFQILDLRVSLEVTQQNSLHLSMNGTTYIGELRNFGMANHSGGCSPSQGIRPLVFGVQKTLLLTSDGITVCEGHLYGGGVALG